MSVGRGLRLLSMPTTSPFLVQNFMYQIQKIPKFEKKFKKSQDFHTLFK